MPGAALTGWGRRGRAGLLPPSLGAEPSSCRSAPGPGRVHPQAFLGGATAPVWSPSLGWPPPLDHHRSGPSSPPDRAPRSAPHLHHTAQHAHHVAHLGMGLPPGVALPMGVQKGQQSLGRGLASRSRPPPSSVPSLQEPLGRGEGGGVGPGHSGRITPLLIPASSHLPRRPCPALCPGLGQGGRARGGWGRVCRRASICGPASSPGSYCHSGSRRAGVPAHPTPPGRPSAEPAPGRSGSPGEGAPRDSPGQPFWDSHLLRRPARAPWAGGGAQDPSCPYLGHELPGEGSVGCKQHFPQDQRLQTPPEQAGQWVRFQGPHKLSTSRAWGRGTMRPCLHSQCPTSQTGSRGRSVTHSGRGRAGLLLAPAPPTPSGGWPRTS